MNIFNSDGWFARIFGTIGDIIVVNILFIICSIPIFTIGASMSAMYYTLLKKQRTGETGGIIKLFFKGFKDNFKKSTIAWLLFMLIAFVFSLDFNLFGKGGPQENKLMYYTSVIFFILICFIAIYLFPVISAFENTLKNLILQSIYMAAKNFILHIACIFPACQPTGVHGRHLHTYSVRIWADSLCIIIHVHKGIFTIPRSCHQAVHR